MIELETQEVSADDNHMHVIVTGDFNAWTVVNFYDIEIEGKDQFSEICQTTEI